MPNNNGQTMTLKARNGHKITVRLEVNRKARRLILRLDERKREAVAVAPSPRQIKQAAAFAAERVEWISSRLQHLPKVIAFEDGAEISYRGEPLRLSFRGPFESRQQTESVHTDRPPLHRSGWPTQNRNDECPARPSTSRRPP